MTRQTRISEGHGPRKWDDAGQARRDAHGFVVKVQRARRPPRRWLPVEGVRVARDRHEFVLAQRRVPLDAPDRVRDLLPDHPERLIREPVVGVEDGREDVVRFHIKWMQPREPERVVALGAQVAICQTVERDDAEVLGPPVRFQYRLQPKTVPGRQRLVDNDEPDEAVRRLLRHRWHADALEEQEARLDERRLVSLLEAKARADDVHVGAAGAPERPHDAAAGVGAISPARSADARVC
mmetsp:Transcript_11951/g.31416  ORF Transcript_11951/g.31416 Transcript_11951/m.31416 type:complete len:238 (+) Transcript_11951:543-1256(+)